MGKKEEKSYEGRKRGLMKKADELSILCGIDLCFLIRGPDFSAAASSSNTKIETWPPQEERVIATIRNYRHPSAKPAKRQRTSSGACSVGRDGTVSSSSPYDSVPHTADGTMTDLGYVNSLSHQELVDVLGTVRHTVEVLNHMIHPYPSQPQQNNIAVVDDPSFDWDNMPSLKELTQMSELSDHDVLSDADAFGGGGQLDYTLAMPTSSSHRTYFPALEADHSTCAASSSGIGGSADSQQYDQLPASSQSIIPFLNWDDMPSREEINQILGIHEHDILSDVDVGSDQPDYTLTPSSSSPTITRCFAALGGPSASAGPGSAGNADYHQYGLPAAVETTMESCFDVPAVGDTYGMEPIDQVLESFFHFDHCASAVDY